MKYDPQRHHRRSIRLKGYDYSQIGLYFITLCVQDRKNIFGEILKGEMKLNLFGKIIEEEWEKTSGIRKNCSLGAYIIMPNHFHSIISIDYQKKPQAKAAKFKSPSHTIGAIIRGFKGATTKKIKEIIIKEEFNPRTGELLFAPMDLGELPFAPTDPGELLFAPIEFIKERIQLKKSIWQRNYWEKIIRDKMAYDNISNYIINNPKKWEEDKFRK